MNYTDSLAPATPRQVIPSALFKKRHARFKLSYSLRSLFFLSLLSCASIGMYLRWEPWTVRYIPNKEFVEHLQWTGNNRLMVQSRASDSEISESILLELIQAELTPEEICERFPYRMTRKWDEWDLIRGQCSSRTEPMETEDQQATAPQESEHRMPVPGTELVLVSKPNGRATNVFDSTGNALATFEGTVPNESCFSPIERRAIAWDCTFSKYGPSFYEAWLQDLGENGNSVKLEQPIFGQYAWSKGGSRVYADVWHECLLGGAMHTGLVAWDSHTGKRLYSLEGKGLVSPLDDIIMMKTDKKIDVWDAITGAHLYHIAVNGKLYEKSAWSPDGAKFAIALDNNQIAICERLRPEPWWGLAWLPESWIALFSSMALGWSILRNRSRRPSAGVVIK